jgi:hypothetical protein
MLELKYPVDLIKVVSGLSIEDIKKIRKLNDKISD